MNISVNIKVNEKCADRLRNGHLWIYDNEIKRIPGAFADGGLVNICSIDGRFIARGYANTASKITARALTFKDEPINKAFFKKRIAEAIEKRKSLGFDVSASLRIVFSEGDFLPGLIVDKYGDVLSAQFLTLGMEVRKKEIVETLVELFSPKAIVERSDSSTREKEGLKKTKGVIYGSTEDKIRITIDNIIFEIDLLEGHKTGFYLDQAENRRAIEPYVKGKKVLDAFANTGSFVLYAIKYGATEVLAIEDSQKTFEGLKRNIELNNAQEKIRVEHGDSFDILRDLIKKGEKYGGVILDPPSFLKTKDKRGGALRGYKDINLLGLKLLEESGFLITASCSHNVSQKAFINSIKEAARDAKCRIEVIDVRGQSKDHPALPAMPETNYLKFVVAKKHAK